MSDPTQVIVIDNSPTGLHFRAHLIYNPEERIGKGTFKTANLASLEFDSVRPLVGLGSHIVDKLAVALKRPFLDVKTASKRPGLRSVNATTPVSRLTVTDEQHAVTGEAKLLVWANALLEFTYDFIFDYAHTNNAPPGVDDFMSIIPHFRFVDAGVAVVVKPLEQTSAGRLSTQRATYLLEEMLPGTPAEFVKYMNNSEATTILERDDSEYELAEFLMFIQHIQYQITHGTAYISDFQGKKGFFIAI
jgi:alpha-kinase family protein